MDRERRERLQSFVLLPLVLVAVAIVTFFTFRTALRVDVLRRQAVVEATLGLAAEKANRLDRQIVDQDNGVMAIADPERLDDWGARWQTTARRETPTIRALLALDESGTVLTFVSRVNSGFAEEDAFRRVLVFRMWNDMDPAKLPPGELRHLHKSYGGQTYLVSYWLREHAGRRYLMVAWHDLGRIIRETFPMTYGDPNQRGQRLNVIDEEGRLIFGPPLRTGEFTVGVRFPTTLYAWRVQVAPVSTENIAQGVENQRKLELLLVGFSAVVIVAGVASILVLAARQRRLSSLKSEFVANVSHELRTPLALVRMFGEMLESGRVSSEEKRAEYLGIIVRESERLTALIENVLDFARLERNGGAVELREGDVNEVVMKAVDAHRYRAERAGVRLQLDLATGLPPLELDERTLQMALSNLIDNALKYGVTNDASHVTVESRRVGREIVVRVIDQGPGVPPEERRRIFERFVRGSHGSIRGSGIGLALVKEVARSHGGRVAVEDASSSPSGGAAFVLALPIPKRPRAKT